VPERKLRIAWKRQGASFNELFSLARKAETARFIKRDGGAGLERSPGDWCWSAPLKGKSAATQDAAGSDRRSRKICSLWVRGNSAQPTWGGGGGNRGGGGGGRGGGGGGGRYFLVILSSRPSTIKVDGEQCRLSRKKERLTKQQYLIPVEIQLAQSDMQSESKTTRSSERTSLQAEKIDQKKINSGLTTKLKTEGPLHRRELLYPFKV